jgi:hypothetical protein
MLWYVLRDGKIWQECYSRREARYWLKILARQYPDSRWGIEQD